MGAAAGSRDGIATAAPPAADDIAVLHSKGWMTETNFERSRYRELYDAIKHMDFQDVVQLIRK